MTESPATAPAAAPAGKPVGEQRGVAFVAIIGLLTFGIYFWIWYFKTGEELKRYSGDGLGGVLWLVIGLVAGIVMIFVAPSEVGKLYKSDGQEAPVSGKTGFWMLLPLIGYFVWVAKVQGSLNRFWASKA